LKIRWALSIGYLSQNHPECPSGGRANRVSYFHIIIYVPVFLPLTAPPKKDNSQIAGSVQITQQLLTINSKAIVLYSTVQKKSSICSNTQPFLKLLPMSRASPPSLKEIVSRAFCFWFFCESSSPKPLISIRVISNFFPKFVEIFASQGAPPVSTTLAANLPPIPLVSLTPMTPLAINENTIRLLT
jgi:hypothetical protein